MGDLYETDFVAWTTEQGRAIRDAGTRRLNAPIDWENVAEEIESLGRSERRELQSRIGTVIEHLLKLELSPAFDPAASWRDTVRRARRQIQQVLKESPSLRPEVPGMVASELTGMKRLVAAAMADYGESPVRDPSGLTYTEAEILDDWFPSSPAVKD